MNTYFIQAEFGVQRKVRAKNEENARANFLKWVEANHPSLLEFIAESIDIVCVAADDDNDIGWTNETH